MSSNLLCLVKNVWTLFNWRLTTKCECIFSSHMIHYKFITFHHSIFQPNTPYTIITLEGAVVTGGYYIFFINAYHLFWSDTLLYSALCSY